MSINLTAEEIAHLAKLARLSLKDEEKDKFRNQLSAILDYVAAVQNIATEDIAPTARALEAENVLRNDQIQGCDPITRESILKNIPDRSGDLLRVPPIFS